MKSVVSPREPGNDLILRSPFFLLSLSAVEGILEAELGDFDDDEDDMFEAVTQLGVLYSQAAARIPASWRELGLPDDEGPALKHNQKLMLNLSEKLLNFVKSSDFLSPRWRIQLQICASSTASLAGKAAITEKQTPHADHRGDYLPPEFHVIVSPIIKNAIKLISGAWVALLAIPWTEPDLPSGELHQITVGPGAFFNDMSAIADSFNLSRSPFSSKVSSNHLHPYFETIMEIIGHYGAMFAALPAFAARGAEPAAIEMALWGLQRGAIHLINFNNMCINCCSHKIIARHAVEWRQITFTALETWIRALTAMAAGPVEAWAAYFKIAYDDEDHVHKNPGHFFFFIRLHISYLLENLNMMLPMASEDKRQLAAALLHTTAALGTIPKPYYKMMMADALACVSPVAEMLLKYKTLINPVLIANDVAGLKAVLALCKLENDDLPNQLQKKPSEMVEDVEALLKIAKEADKNDEERAKGRAILLRALPCANLACPTLRGLGEERIKGKLCAGCKCVRYCGSKCQKKDWGSGGHKLACKAIAAE